MLEKRVWWAKLYSPNSYGECKTSQQDFIRDGVLKDVIKLEWSHWGGSNPIWLEEIRTDTHRRMTMWGHREKTAIYTPRRGASGDTSPAHNVISNFQPPGRESVNVFCLRESSLWYLSWCLSGLIQGPQNMLSLLWERTIFTQVSPQGWILPTRYFPVTQERQRQVDSVRKLHIS